MLCLSLPDVVHTFRRAFLWLYGCQVGFWLFPRSSIAVYLVSHSLHLCLSFFDAAANVCVKCGVLQDEETAKKLYSESGLKWADVLPESKKPEDFVKLMVCHGERTGRVLRYRQKRSWR